MGQETLSYDAIASLIGKLILQQHFQIEQIGKSLAEAQKRYNDEHEQVVRLRQELTRLRSLPGPSCDDDSAGKRTTNE
jgi:hypothetical protein